MKKTIAVIIAAMSMLMCFGADIYATEISSFKAQAQKEAQAQKTAVAKPKMKAATKPSKSREQRHLIECKNVVLRRIKDLEKYSPNTADDLRKQLEQKWNAAKDDNEKWSALTLVLDSCRSKKDDFAYEMSRHPWSVPKRQQAKHQ